MNKKLIALAVAGACGVPAAMAQTANPVTLYGRVYVTLESVEASGSAAGINATLDPGVNFGLRPAADRPNAAS